MADQDGRGSGDKQAGKFLGSLREALAAASRDDTTRITGLSERTAPPDTETRQEIIMLEAATDVVVEGGGAAPAREDVAQIPPPLPSAAEAAREARGGTPNIPPVDRHVEFDAPPTTRVVRPAAATSEGSDMTTGETARTQLVRGQQKVERGTFNQDPVVGWVVVVGGPGIGAYRPIFEGNNTVGRGQGNRIAIDFGDDAISTDEQAYIRYDSADRSFLFVPNMAKTNVVSVNDKRPSAAVPLQSMDVITMGRTQLVFVSFCGPEFDWSELTELKA